MLKARGRYGGRTGTKILLEAINNDQVHLARFVLDALDGEIVDSKSDGAQTPLISAMLLPDSQARCKFAELLLQRGADVNCQDCAGRTALSYACEKGLLDAVKTLVRNNADPEILDAWGNSSLMYAVVAGHSPVVEFLVRAFKRLGLQIERQNKVGNSALEVAKLLGHTECVTALTSTSRKEREAGGGAPGKEQRQLSLGCGDENDTLERVGLSANKLHIHRKDCRVVQNRTWQPRPRVKLSQIPSMGSIGELDREYCASSSPPQELDLTEVRTPKPPPRTSDHSPSSQNPKPGERLTHLNEPLPPLTQSHGAKQTMFFSPQPTGHSPKLSAPSALDILLTPILSSKSERAARTDKSRRSDFGVRTFHDSYYQKRCSLPTSVLSPTSPVRAPAPLRKSRTVRRREASPCKAEPAQFAEPAAATPSTTFSVLRNKLLRRFTSLEFKGDVKELTSGRMPRSETFPQDTKHPQVGSKPSIDSISSVTCEFDFHLRMQNT